MLQPHLLRARRLTITSILALALAQLGCSFIFVTPPSSSGSSRGAKGDSCTTSKAAPIIDTVIGGYQIFRTGSAFVASDEVYKDAPISRHVDITAGLALTTLFVTSAIYGYSKTSQCKASRQGYRYSTEEPEDEEERIRRLRHWN